MNNPSTLDLINQRKPRWAMPREVYLSDQVYQDDLKHIWYATWIFAGHTFELPKHGSFMTLQLGDYPIVIVRTRKGEIKAYHNSCKHRGHRICTEQRGSSANLVCPYHRWTYDYDGQLVFASSMGASFDPSEFRLDEVAVGVAASYIYVCVADNPPDFRKFADMMAPFVQPHNPDNLKVAHMTTSVEHGNWKLVFENNRECFHCDANHPELLRTYEENHAVSGLTGDDDPDLMKFLDTCEQGGLPSRLAMDEFGQFRMTRIQLLNGASSYTMDGRPAVNRRLDNTDVDEIGALLYFHYPNTWNHFMADHALSFQMLPLGKNATQLVTRWLVPKDAEEGKDYDLDHLTRCGMPRMNRTSDW